jgi:HAMP domain-containing protein
MASVLADRSQTDRAGRRGSLYRSLFIVFVVGIVLPLLVIFALTVATAWFGQQQLNTQLQGQLESVTSLQRRQLNQWIDDRQRTLAVLTSQPEVFENARTALEVLPQTPEYKAATRALLVRLNLAQNEDIEFFAYLLVDVSDSRVVLSTDERYIGLFMANKEFYAQGRTRPYVQLPGFDLDEPHLREGASYMVVTEPILDVSGNRTRGVLVGLVDTGRLNEIFGQVKGLEQGQVYLFTPKGYLVSTSNAQALSANPNPQFPDDPQLKNVVDSHSAFTAKSYTNFLGQPVFGRGEWWTYQGPGENPLDVDPDRGLVMFVEQPQSVAFRAINQVSLLYYALAVMGLLGVGAVAFAGRRLTDSLVRPIETLTQSAERIAGGDLDHRVSVARNDEIGLLAASFNRMTSELRGLYAGLEQKVAERTQDLEEANAQIIRRALQLQTSAEVARAASSILEVDQLLDQVVNLIRERFGFYHVQVFLLDAAGEYAVLRASTGEVGRQLLGRHHRLGVGSQSLIGYVTANRIPHVAMDVADDPFHRYNPLLPETRAELGIPLMVGERLIGVLDVQSTDVNAFGTEDIALFESLAAQIAVALDNARLFQESQRLARRERQINELTAKIRGSVDTEHIMEIAVHELGRALSASRVVARTGGLTETPGSAGPAAESSADGPGS